MTLSPIQTVLRPFPGVSAPPTSPVSAGQKSAVQTDLDTFERVAPTSTQEPKNAVAAEINAVLQDVKAEKYAQNTNPVFPSTSFDELTRYPVIKKNFEPRPI